MAYMVVNRMCRCTAKISKRKLIVKVQFNMEQLWPVSIESFEISCKYLSGWPEPERGKITLQVKLAQWSLIKFIFPLEGFPILTSIYVPTSLRCISYNLILYYLNICFDDIKFKNNIMRVLWPCSINVSTNSSTNGY